MPWLQQGAVLLMALLTLTLPAVKAFAGDSSLLRAARGDASPGAPAGFALHRCGGLGRSLHGTLMPPAVSTPPSPPPSLLLPLLQAVPTAEADATLLAAGWLGIRSKEWRRFQPPLAVLLSAAIALLLWSLLARLRRRCTNIAGLGGECESSRGGWQLTAPPTSTAAAAGVGKLLAFNTNALCCTHCCGPAAAAAGGNTLAPPPPPAAGARGPARRAAAAASASCQLHHTPNIPGGGGGWN